MKWTIFFCMFFIALESQAQVGLQIDKEKTLSIQLEEVSKKSLLPARTYFPAKQNDKPLDTSLQVLMSQSPILPNAYSYEELSLFCKLEVKMEKAVQFPVKFRLGDVQYVDWLEGKDNYWRFDQPKN